MASSGHTSDGAYGADSAATHERLRSEAAAALAPVEWSPSPDSGPVLADLVLAGAPDPATRQGAAFAIEAVLEGFLCHQGIPRLFRAGDPDRALLTGDLLYALGLRAVAQAGETESVRILADLIGVAAGLASEGRRTALTALWVAQALALGDPADEARNVALEQLLDGTDPDGSLLLEAVSASASPAGADGAFGRAVDALQSLFQMADGTR